MSDYTVEVNIKDLGDEIKKNIDIIIHNLLKRFIEENKIETLYKIIFTDNWDEEITDFQKNNNLSVRQLRERIKSNEYERLPLKNRTIRKVYNIKCAKYFEYHEPTRLVTPQDEKNLLRTLKRKKKPSSKI